MKYTKSIISILASLMVLASCKDPVMKDVVPYIEIDKLEIQAGYEGLETVINIQTNTQWALTRTDEEGNTIDWVKFDKLSANGNTELGVKVVENPTQEERKALITFEAGDEKAFLEVVQEANPNEPVIPDEPILPDNPIEGNKKVLRFDFTTAPQGGWPVVSDQSAGRTDLNKPFTYTFEDGTTYDLTFRCIPSATQAKSYWTDNGYLYIETYRYLELPIIEGYVIEQVDCAVGKKADAIGYVTSEITTATSVLPAEDSESQSWNVDAGTILTYMVNATSPSKQYYLYSGKPNGLRVSYIEITYAPAEDSGSSENPDQPEPVKTMELEFDFTTEPQPGWPTVQGDAAANMNKTVTYTLNGTPYTFILMEAPGAKGEKIFWRHEGDNNYFALAAPYRYLGLPIIDGYALKTVDCTIGKQNSSTAAYVTSAIGGITKEDHPTTDTDAQSWDKAAGTVITYEVNAINAAKQYYLYCKSTNTILSNLKLTYEKL